MITINYKNLDYEIETILWCENESKPCIPINYKNLDYEIETESTTSQSGQESHRSTIRISITRLKLITELAFHKNVIKRSTIRISITRLKQRCYCVALRPWYPINYKNLDYAIETKVVMGYTDNHKGTINYKNLDYEIETRMSTRCRVWWMADQL